MKFYRLQIQQITIFTENITIAIPPMTAARISENESIVIKEINVGVLLGSIVFVFCVIFFMVDDDNCRIISTVVRCVLVILVEEIVVGW